MEWGNGTLFEGNMDKRNKWSLVGNVAKHIFIHIQYGLRGLEIIL